MRVTFILRLMAFSESEYLVIAFAVRIKGKLELVLFLRNRNRKVLI
jgi:hypothetical protein